MSKISFTIEYAGLQLQIIKNEQGKDVTPLKPIADLFGLDWETQRQKVSNSAYYAKFYGTCTGSCLGSDGQKREQTCILLSRVAAYLQSLNPEMIRAKGNENGADFLEAKQTEWADALHDYEDLGVAVNLNHIKTQEILLKQRMGLAKVMAIKNQTQGKEDRQMLGHVIQQMAGELGVSYQPDLLEGE
jgi:hypothetical protein